MKRVAIVGGGLAGLTCAWSMKRKGMEPIVFEAAPAAGGRAMAAPFLLDRGLFRNTFDLIRELGLSDEVLPIEPLAGQAYKGKVYRHRVASAAGLLKFKGLNIFDKAMLPRMALLLHRYAPLLDFHRVARGIELDDESVATFIRRELSQNVLNYVAGPLISTLFFYGSEETSKLLYLMLVRHMYNTRMSTLRGGLDRISAKLAKEVQIVHDRAVTTIATEGDSYLIHGERFSDVVVAIPGDTVLGIHGMRELLSGEDQEFFRDCRYQRLVSLVIGTDHPVDGQCYAVSIPRVEGLTASAITFLDFIDPSNVPERRGLLSVTGGGEKVAEDRLMDDVHRFYKVQPQFTRVHEWNSGMPKFPPGRYRQIVAFQKRERRPGLFFCGDYLMGPFVEAAITTGLEAGRKIG